MTQGTTPQATVWDIAEIALTGPTDGNPFVDVTLTSPFRHGGRTLQVQGFHDGEGIWRLRLMPDQPGLWHWTTASNSPALDGQSGTIEVAPALPGAHGPVVADGLNLRHADGTPFINLGTTAYAWNHQSPELQAQTLASLSAAPFTKIRMCVFPKNSPCSFYHHHCKL